MKNVMMRSWVVYWFLAVVIYVLGKVIKDKKIGSFPAIYVTNLIAIVLGGYATYLMLQQG